MQPQRSCRMLLAAALVGSQLGVVASQDPLERTIGLLTQLQGQVSADMERAGTAYGRYKTWCGTTSSEEAGQVDTYGREKGRLEAAIQTANSDIEASTERVEELVKEGSVLGQKLRDVVDIRNAEKKSFEESESTLMESIKVLGQAITLLEKEIQGSSGSLLQTSIDTNGLETSLLALGAIIDAFGEPTENTPKLAVLLAARQAARESATPSPQAYTYQSQTIVEVMEDMRDKAQEQLRQLRGGESNSETNFLALKANLEQQVKTVNNDLKTAKSDKAAAEGAKATAQGDLEVAKRELASSTEALKNTKDSCIRLAADHEASMHGRSEELVVLAKAKKTIQASMLQTPASFVQLASQTEKHSHVSLICRQVVTVIKQLAAQHKSVSLGQLASRLTTVVRFAVSSGSKDPFAKVKQLILDMVKRLEGEMTTEAREKEYCDSELRKTEEQKTDLSEKIDGLRAKTQQAESKSTVLKAEVKHLAAELAQLATQRAELSQARAVSKAAFAETKAGLQKSLDGVRSAIRMLRDYYSNDEGAEASLLQGGEQTETQSDESFTAAMKQPEAPVSYKKASGAGAGIIGILEVAESDLAKSLAQEDTDDTSEGAEYEKQEQSAKVLTAMRTQDVSYKTQEYKALDKAIAEFTSDFETSDEELDAVLAYDTKVKERCLAPRQSFAERRATREAEVRGLQEALAILQDDAASATLLQRGGRAGPKRPEEAQATLTVHF